MKVAIINDVHIGVRNDAPVFLDAHEKFFTSVFIPTLLDQGIDTVLILGDLFDRRKYISFNTLYRVKKFLFDKLRDENITVHLLVGNHDVAYKNTNRVNSPELLLAEYENVHVYTEPTELMLGEEKVGLVPWINMENDEAAFNFIRDFSGDLLFGHFEINGFEMYRNGGVCHEGIDGSVFSKYEHVFSGHFHEPSFQGNIKYLGSPMQFTWNDYGCSRGFSIFDWDIRDVIYIKNEDEMFHKIIYTDELGKKRKNWNHLKDRVVRIVVKEKTDQHRFDLFIDKIQGQNPYQLDIVDSTDYTIDDGLDDSIVKNEDTLTIVGKYIDSLDLNYDNSKIKNLFRDLYVEALAELD